jgi:iron complex transport system ATP-binding protein
MNLPDPQPDASATRGAGGSASSSGSTAVAAGQTTALEVRDFSFSIAGKAILRNVSLAVQAGQYVSLVGPNGAGKTTLLKCIDRILPGGRGDLRVWGRPLAAFRQRELALQIGYVPQSEGRLFPFSVEQFVLMGRYPYLSPFAAAGRSDREAVRRAMQQTDTLQFADRAVDSLSGGERQRVLIAAAVAQGARLWLLDEPTTFLDYRHQDGVLRLLREINRRDGVTMLAVTHDINQAALQSDRIVGLRDGRVVFAGTPREAMQPEALREIYGTRFVTARHPTADLPMVLPRAEGDADPRDDSPGAEDRP